MGTIQFSNTTAFSAFIKYRHKFQLGTRQLLLYGPSISPALSWIVKETGSPEKGMDLPKAMQ